MDIKYYTDMEEKIKKVKKVLSFLCKSGVVVSAGLILAVIISNLVSVSKENKFKDYEIVEAVAVGDVVNEFTDVNKKKVLNSYLPVDINNDGKRDFNIYIAVDKTSDLSLKEFQLLEIKKDAKLVLEGVIEKDIMGDMKSMKSIGNGVEVIDNRYAVVDNKRGVNYMNADNIIAVDGNIVNMPKNNENVNDVVFLLNKGNIGQVLTLVEKER